MQLAALILLALLAGCATTQCHNPRSMACMSQDDLIRELARPIP